MKRGLGKQANQTTQPTGHGQQEKNNDRGNKIVGFTVRRRGYVISRGSMIRVRFWTVFPNKLVTVGYLQVLQPNEIKSTTGGYIE